MLWNKCKCPSFCSCLNNAIAGFIGDHYSNCFIIASTLALAAVLSLSTSRLHSYVWPETMNQVGRCHLAMGAVTFLYWNVPLFFCLYMESLIYVLCFHSFLFLAEILSLTFLHTCYIYKGFQAVLPTRTHGCSSLSSCRICWQSCRGVGLSMQLRYDALKVLKTYCFQRCVQKLSTEFFFSAL